MAALLQIQVLILKTELIYSQIVIIFYFETAGINIAKLPKDMQTRLIKDYYGSDGIEYSLGRVPIGGCDFSTHPYSYDDHPNDDNLTKFSLQPEDIHYKVLY